MYCTLWYNTDPWLYHSKIPLSPHYSIRSIRSKHLSALVFRLPWSQCAQKKSSEFWPCALLCCLVSPGQCLIVL